MRNGKNQRIHGRKGMEGQDGLYGKAKPKQSWAERLGGEQGNCVRMRKGKKNQRINGRKVRNNTKN